MAIKKTTTGNDKFSDLDGAELCQTVPSKKHSVTLITYALCGLTILSILILTIVSAIKMDELHRDELRVRITGVVGILAKTVIDGDLHSQVRTIADKKSAAFSKIKRDLEETRQQNTSIANIYTMRKLDDGTVIFVVDGSEKDQNEIGDVYPQKSVTEILINAFNATPETDTIYTETKIYTDDWGTWLSAYAPIFTSSGKLDGIIGIDISAENFKENGLTHISILFIVALVVILITLLFVLQLMRLIKKMNLELEQANDELVFENTEKERVAAELADFHVKHDLLINQVNHVQKLESIERMTSGLAHEFNNILGCILGYNEMNQYVSDDMTEEKLKAELENNIKQVSLAVRRAVDLINQMLTYCRQDDAPNVKMDIQPTQAVLEKVLMILRPTLPSRIKIETVFESDEIIEIDAIDLQQIVTNLVVNARDAMKEHGGIITISLKLVTNVTFQCAACASVVDGDFIELSVADNGTGIESTLIDQIFDPFFTTKPQGEGSGLGLSVVGGLVAKSGGHFLVESNQSKFNHGTEFKLLFPMSKTHLPRV